MLFDSHLFQSSIVRLHLLNIPRNFARRFLLAVNVDLHRFVIALAEIDNHPLRGNGHHCYDMDYYELVFVDMDLHPHFVVSMGDDPDYCIDHCTDCQADFHIVDPYHYILVEANLKIKEELNAPLSINSNIFILASNC